MQRTTIMLPAELKSRALRKASQLGISFGELVRESLGAFLRKPAGDGIEDDPLFTDSAVFEGKAPADGAVDHDHHLYGDVR